MTRPTDRQSFWRNLWSLVGPYWVSKDRKAAWILVILVLGLNIFSVYLNVLYSDWNNRFYNSLQNKDFDAFKHEMMLFSVLAAIMILSSVYSSYFRQWLRIRWRRWLTDRLLRHYLTEKIYYRLQMGEAQADNPDQRIADDIDNFIEYTLFLTLGVISAVLTLAAFALVLWNLSGELIVPVLGHEFVIPGYMMWAAIFYAIAGTWLTHLIGRPLIRLNFLKEKVEADFRFSLVRLRENAEGVALYDGEQEERRFLGQRFNEVMKNFWSIMNRTKFINFFITGYNQVAIIFPFVVAGPRFFAGKIQLGDLMQIGVAFDNVRQSLSFFVDRYADIALWRAVVDRLTGFIASVETLSAADTLSRIDRHLGQAIEVGNLTLELPNGQVLTRPIDFTVQAGERVLIVGKSGSGKSTLLRVLAGIWPYAHGRVMVPHGQEVLFLPQRPYLPLGNLRAVLSYPGEAGVFTDAQLVEALKTVDLGHLADRLEEERLWSQILSGGEMQRVAIARALLHKPRWLFLDEATSALDEGTEEALYERLAADPATTIVSVGHRSTLARFHQRKIDLSEFARG